MQHLFIPSVIPLLDGHRSASSVPAKTRLAIGRCAASIAMFMLLGSIVGFAGAAQAQPVATGQSSSISATDPFAHFVAEAVDRFGVPARWISAVMMAESGGDVQAVSPQGAMGLMQIMPNTWADLRTRYGLGADPYEPRDNILAGAAYLREMHDRYGSPGFIAAYNAGPKRYEEHLAIGRELPTETQLFVVALAPMIGDAQVAGTVAITRRAVSWQDSPLFAALTQADSAAQPLSLPTPSDRSLAGGSVVGMSALTPRADGLFVHQASTGRSP